jgi:molybdopterin synthase sulfur carrier subunit
MNTRMTVTVRYFASLREALGASEVLDLAAGSTLGQLRDSLIQRGGAHAQALARGRALRCALNQVMADEATAVPADAEVAFFPPVTGG